MTKNTEIIEKLAALQHEAWAHWTKYMLSRLAIYGEGTIPACISCGYSKGHANDCDIARWHRQIDTPYADLTEKEKDSDREWARKVLEVLETPPEFPEPSVRCPRCGGQAAYTCWNTEPGATAPARCMAVELSLYQRPTDHLPDPECDWVGAVVRDEDGKLKLQETP